MLRGGVCAGVFVFVSFVLPCAASCARKMSLWRSAGHVMGPAQRNARRRRPQSQPAEVGREGRERPEAGECAAHERPAGRAREICACIPYWGESARRPHMCCFSSCDVRGDATNFDRENCTQSARGRPQTPSRKGHLRTHCSPGGGKWYTEGGKLGAKCAQIVWASASPLRPISRSVWLTPTLCRSRQRGVRDSEELTYKEDKEACGD